MKFSQSENDFFNKCAEELLSSKQYQLMKKFVQHGETSCHEHCVNVANFSYLLCIKTGLKCDLKSIIRGALLHDFFLYDWHKQDKSHRLHGFKHPKTALKNAEIYFSLNELERDIITKHMWPFTIKPPKHIESMVVCLVDKYCAVRETYYPCRNRLRNLWNSVRKTY